MRTIPRVVPYVRCFMFALMVMLALCLPASSAAQFSAGVAVSFAPPDLPVYEQPIIPGEGYIWTPGYWAWDPNIGDYFWVPGTWVLAPQVGYLWTPGYWAWGGNGFVFYEGFWGPVVGFYGGVNYGYGYFGHGYQGGRWDGDRFYYNRSVNNINVTNIHNVYNTTINERETTRVSYNGGQGGINVRPTPEQEAAARERRIPPVPAQRQHAEAARANPDLRASANHGKPPIAATPRPGAFNEHGAVPARQGGAVHNAGGNNGGNNNPGHANAVHPNDLPPTEHPAPPSTGNSKQDQKYQQQQQKLEAQQEKDRQKLQQQQEKQHQQLQKQNADEARKQQVEQQHQQQTQQMQQKHAEQQQHLQQKQPPPPPPKENQPKQNQPKEKQ